jgi:hypothetical protein
MTSKGTASAKVTTKMGDKYEVHYEFYYESETRTDDKIFEFEINSIYDEDGWEVTETLDETTKEEIEELAISEFNNR